DSARVLQGRQSSLENNMQVAEQAVQRFKDQNPEVKLSSSLKNLLEDSLAVETERAELKLQYDILVNHYDSDHFLIQELNIRLAQLRQERDVLDELMGDYIGLEGELLRLERDAAVTANLFNTVSKELKELQAAEENDSQSHIQAEFDVSRPVGVEPKRLLVLAVPGLLGVMLGVFIVLMRAFMRPVIDAPMALQNLTGLNTIAVPDVQSRRSSKRRPAAWRLLIDDQPASPALESMRALRAAFDGQENIDGTATLAFVGPTADVGKNFVAANTAALLALEGKRVLLIDADMRRSRLHEYLGYESGLPGLAQLLSGQAVVEDALIRPREGLTVLPAGVRPANSTELLLQPGFASMIDELSADYYYVIHASASILPVAISC